MKINDFLQIVLDSDYSVYASGNIGHEQVRVSVDNLHFSLCIKPTSSTGVIIELNYSHKNHSSGLKCEPTLEVEIDEIKSFMDAINQKELVDFYKTEKWNKNNIQQSEILINVFKSILEQKPISNDYSFKHITNENFPKGAIELTEKDSESVHVLDFSQFVSSYGAKKLRVCTDKLGIMIRVNSNQSKTYNFKIPTSFKFYIAAYDIDKYPLLSEQNEFKKAHNHTEFDGWLNNIINYAYTSKKDLPEALSKHLLKENLDTDLSDNHSSKISKNKI